MTSTTQPRQLEVEPWVTDEITQVHVHIGRDALKYVRIYLREKEDKKSWPQARIDRFRRMYHYVKAMFFDAPEHVLEKDHRKVINDLCDTMNMHPLHWSVEDLLFAWWAYFLLGDEDIINTLASFDSADPDWEPKNLKQAAIKQTGIIMYAVNESKGLI